MAELVILTITIAAFGIGEVIEKFLF